MSASWQRWCGPLALLVACSGGDRRPSAGADRARAVADPLDAGTATSPAAAAVPPGGAAAIDAGTADDRGRHRTPRSAQVIAEDLARLAESRARFDALAREHGGSYRYVNAFSSWTGVDAETTVRVEHGVVVERRFEIRRVDGRRSKRLHGWTERAGKVGSHAHEGDPATLLEQRYDECQRRIARSDRVDGLTIWLDFDDRGLLAHCASEHVICSDPCWQGTSLRSLEFGP